MNAIITIFCCILATSLFSQSNIQQPSSINSDGAAPATSAMLDVQATDKGVLVPRMTTAQRTAIASPATGLLVFDTTTGKFWVYTGSAWQQIVSNNSGATASLIADADGNTKVQTEESANEDKIRFDLNGTERFVMTGTRLEVKNSGNSVFIGSGAGANDDLTNNKIVAVGENALASNTSGTANTAIGFEALYANVSSSGNTAVGGYALRNNTSGISNTAIGAYAMETNSSGANNTALGNSALFNNTAGDANVAIGAGALSSNTSGSFNTVTGRAAMNDNTTGSINAAFGNFALGNNTVGSYNAAFGYGALGYNINGNYNTSIGSYSMSLNTAGDDNTAVGFYALHENVWGENNIAVGNEALYSNLFAFNNTSVGVRALKANATGENNTALGFEACNDATDNQLCTVIGAQSDVGTAINGYDNATAIGYDCNITANNYARIGNTSVTSIGGQVGWSTYSDGRFKRQVQENVAGLDFITRLRPVTYQWDIHALNDFIPTTEDSTDWTGKYDIEKMRFTGFIAQEVEQAAADAGFDFSGVDKPQNETTPYALRYAEFVVPLVKGMQEQQKIIENGEWRMENLERENATLKTQLEAEKLLNERQAAQLDKITAALAGAGIAVEK